MTTGNLAENHLVFALPRLNDKLFQKLSRFIVRQVGIKMPPIKKTLLQGRLQKRLKALNMSDFEQYVHYLFSAQGQKEELSLMINEVSTNKTSFFREPVHFNFLIEQGLNAYLQNARKNKLSIWSAGCSTGEEPYSIAMTLREYNFRSRWINFDILATDISTRVLDHARLGIFDQVKIDDIPENLRKKYLTRGKNEFANKFRIHSELRNRVTFEKFNLTSQFYTSAGVHDIIFCRNVLIYFDVELQYTILKKFCNQLLPGGYLFLGHSESITGMSLPLKQISPSTFMKI
jgi:chemotaxis protein methyltransferase CheR